jgi:hypothetical protein
LEEPICEFGWESDIINSVLASIPVFYLSLFKIPLKVRMTIVRIQRSFLWGGALGEKNKIAPKEDGGLGVRDLKRFNLSLLAKWRWRLLVEDGSLWKNVLEVKYGAVGMEEQTCL